MAGDEAKTPIVFTFAEVQKPATLRQMKRARYEDRWRQHNADLTMSLNGVRIAAVALEVAPELADELKATIKKIADAAVNTFKKRVEEYDKC